MSTFKIHILTPTSDFYSGEIDYMCVDTPDGKVGLMRGALPRVAAVSAGEIDIKTAVLQLKARCGDGFMTVEKDGVTVLVESCAFDGDEPAQADDDREKSMREYKLAKARIATSLGKKAKE